MLQLLVALLAASYVTASPGANYYVDSLLRGPLQTELRNYGLLPSSLPDFRTDFVDHVTFIGKVHGQANYTNGRLFGLNNTFRYSECQGPSYSYGAPHVNCSIALDLSSEHNVKVKYGKLPAVPVKATSNITRYVLFVEVAQNPNQAPYIFKYDFLQYGQVYPKFTGLGSTLNKFLKVLEDGYKTQVSAATTDNLHRNFIAALNRAVASTPLPY